jgi:plasmid stabilization system protein ParE
LPRYSIAFGDEIAYSPQAVKQITRAFDYIGQDDPTAANAFLLRVESIASLLSGRPGIGRVTQKAGVQVIGLLPYRYLLFYKMLRPRRSPNHSCPTYEPQGRQPGS